MADKLKRNTCKNTGMVEQIHHQAEEHHRWSAAVVIFAFAIIMYVMRKPQYVRLITCETTSQASEIIDTLDSAGSHIKNPMTD